MRDKAKGQDLLSLFHGLNGALKAQVEEAATSVFPPPPISGIGNAGWLHADGRAQGRQRRLRQAAERHRRRSWRTPHRNPRCRSSSPRSARPRRNSTSRSTAPRRRHSASRSGRCSPRCRTIVGSSYVTQFNKFGQVFQVYVQADVSVRMQPDDITRPEDQDRRPAQMVPLGTLLDIKKVAGTLADRSLQSLSRGDDHRPAGDGLQLRPGDGADGADQRERTAAAGHGHRLVGDVVPGEDRRQSDLLRLRARRAARLLRARGPVRELVTSRAR